MGAAPGLDQLMSTRAQGPGERAADQAGAEHHHPHLPALAARAWRSGTLASLLSTLAVTLFSRRHAGAAAAGTNAASQWFWYPHARHVRRPSARYTLAGYAVHHASSVWWACAFELLHPRRATPRGRAVRAAGVAALAGVILIVVNLGVFVLFATALWTLARGAFGALRLTKGKPIANPHSWLF